MPRPTTNASWSFKLAVVLWFGVIVAGTADAQNPAIGSPTPPQIAALAAVQPVVECGKLATVDVSDRVGAKTHITSAEAVQDGKPAPYCRVLGYVEPAVRFEVRLPLTTWTQRYVQTGCGGLCGQLSIRLGNEEGCYPAEHGDLALASTDMGHSGGMDGEFGDKNYQLRIDFAYRGVHVTALAAKALIAAFYGQAPRFSYFSGCSDGGREGLMEAQRYPLDFNGITAGAPAMNFTTQNTFYHGWNATKNTGPDGQPILTADKLPILHRAALAACDAADGAEDGLISDPLSCHFDPAGQGPGVVECKAGAATDSCLTHAQVEVARAIYEGAHDATGDKLVLSGPLPGSELAWAGVYVPSPGDNHIMSSMISTGSLKYLVYDKNPGPDYTLKDLQFTPAAFTGATQLHGVYDATDPDLTPFEKAGGKLILWHGLADPHISPVNTIAYYTAMNQVMGEGTVRDFARLYLFPGGYHCGGGEGPFTFDLMSAIMGWVEKGSAPFAMMASHETESPGEPMAGAPMHSQNQASFATTRTVDRVRPVFPYPLTSQYDGVGNPNDPNSFKVGPAKPISPARLQWLGSGFYTPHYELWCRPQGTSMNCSAKP